MKARYFDLNMSAPGMRKAAVHHGTVKPRDCGSCSEVQPFLLCSNEFLNEFSNESLCILNKM